MTREERHKAIKKRWRLMRYAMNSLINIESTGLRLEYVDLVWWHDDGLDPLRLRSPDESFNESASVSMLEAVSQSEPSMPYVPRVEPAKVKEGRSARARQAAILRKIRQMGGM